MNIHIDTERTIIRELIAEDMEGMFVMNNDPEVHRFLGNKPCATRDESRAEIEFIRKQYLDEGIGRWAIVLKDSDEFVGWTGFKRIRESINGHINHLDFGYRLARRHWGKGLAKETGSAALHYGLHQLRLNDIYAMTDVENTASRNILEFLGFELMGLFPYDGAPTWRQVGQPTTWYQLAVQPAGDYNSASA